MDGTLQAPTLGAMDAHGIIFDPCGGIGARQQRRAGGEVCAIAVAMRPAVFLRLAPPLAVPRPSLAWLAARIGEGCAICPPMLRVWIPAWVRPGSVPAVTAHDGRHRMMALQALLGPAAEVPVHVELPALVADEAVPAAVIAAMRAGMRSQSAIRDLVPGPLFGASDTDIAGSGSDRASRAARAPPRSTRRHIRRHHHRTALRTRRRPCRQPRYRPALLPGLGEPCR